MQTSPLAPHYLPLLPGGIQTRSRIVLAHNRLETARLRTTSRITVAHLEGQWLFEGRIGSSSTARLTPTVAMLEGRIGATSLARLLPLPIVPQAEEPACPAPAEIDDYLDLITSEHRPRPRYMATVEASVAPLVDDQNLVATYPCLFDLDISVGQQEDFVGQWIGKTRFVELGDVYFSWDVNHLGWDEANWRGPYDPPNSISRLDDYHYRLLLYAAIVNNHWDGSIPAAYRAWDILFAETGYRVLIQDNGNMTMLLGLMGTGPIDRVTQALFQGGNMDLKPEGIDLVDYVFQATPDVPFFAWDSYSDSVAGWDIGYWGILVPPGQGFVPGP